MQDYFTRVSAVYRKVRTTDPGANTHKENTEALEVVTHLVAIKRALDTLTVEGEPR